MSTTITVTFTYDNSEDTKQRIKDNFGDVPFDEGVQKLLLKELEAAHSMGFITAHTVISQ